MKKMSAIEAKLDAIMNRMNNQERISHSVNEVGIVEVLSRKILLIRDLLIKVHTKLRKLCILMEIGVITSSLTTNSQPTTHQP